MYIVGYVYYNLCTKYNTIIQCSGQTSKQKMWERVTVPMFVQVDRLDLGPVSRGHISVHVQSTDCTMDTLW